MILLAGIPSEPPMRMVANALEDLNYPYIVWNQRHIAQSRIDFEFVDGSITGAISLGDTQINLDEITGIYVRIMDEEKLPELRNLPVMALERRYSRAQHEAFMLWLDLTPARVANRPSSNGSNGSKPWQARLIEAAGFLTPDTLITNNPDSVRNFHNRNGDLIYKSASGFRSVVRSLANDDEDRLNSIRWCPVQFQKRVPGYDVRVHVIGNEVFATRIISDATDYRYATCDGLSTKLEVFDLSTDLAAKCRKLSRKLDLPFAGIDLRIHEDEAIWCFEVNPCPGFSYYESHTGQPISASVARYLIGA